MEASCFGFEEDDPIESNDGGTSRPVHFVKPTFRFVCNVQSKSKTMPCETVQNVHVREAAERTVSSPMPENPVSITQVQELLLQDMSPTRDSSFYEELQNEESENKEMDTPVRVRKTRKKRQLEETNDQSINDENVENVERTPARVKARPAHTKRPLGEIQNFDDSVTEDVENMTKKKGKAKNAEKTPMRVFTRPAQKKIQDENEDVDICTIAATKPVVKRKGKKNAENERNEQLMDQFVEQMNSKFKAVEDYQLVIE